MHTLLFEVQPRAGHEDHYFAHATRLRPLLDAHPGLLFIDRFKSLVRPNIILSHSHWQDEASLARWRTDAQHRRSQAAGRNQHFEDYRIRISRVVTHYVRGEPPGARAQVRWRSDLSSRSGRFLTITATQGAPFSEEGEAFRSVYIEGAFLSVTSWDSDAEAEELVSRARRDSTVTNAISALVSRDYGMFDREEAPQRFPAPARTR